MIYKANLKGGHFSVSDERRDPGYIHVFKDGSKLSVYVTGADEQAMILAKAIESLLEVTR